MPQPARPKFTWQLRTRTLALGDRTLLMGVVNVTPDSFSDGGAHFAEDRGPDEVVAHALQLLDEGADILDIGAESTRPGATALTPAAEQARLLPVLEALRRERPEAVLSVDTYHASTARCALTAGAEIINDVSGLRWDAGMAAELARSQPQPGLVLMHTRGRPAEWRTMLPLAASAVTDLVLAELRTQFAVALETGLAPESIVLDPGFGFGKLGGANLALLQHLPALHTLGRPLLAGLSRKGFLQRSDSLNTANSAARLHATLAANTAAVLAGTHILRVHDIAAAREAAAVADALLLQHP